MTSKSHTSSTSPDAASATHSLAGFDLFEGVPESERRAFEHRCVFRVWPRGTLVVGGGALGSSVHFVMSGRCRIALRMPKREIVVDEIGPGEFFGELSAIDGERRSAVVMAMTRTRTAEIDGERFLEFLARNPRAALEVMRRLAQVIRQTDAAILDLSGLNAQGRICVELLRRARVGGDLPPNCAVLSPAPKHAEIAMRAATTRETVARALSHFAQQGLLQRRGQLLMITDVEALGRLTEIESGG